MTAPHREQWGREGVEESSGRSRGSSGREREGKEETARRNKLTNHALFATQVLSGAETWQEVAALADGNTPSQVTRGSTVARWPHSPPPHTGGEPQRDR